MSINPFDDEYHKLLNRILSYGAKKKDRTGTGTLGVFGHMMWFDLSQGFPLVTTKKIPIRLIVHELLWMLSGSTNVKYLQDNNVKIWDGWSKADYRPEMGYPEGELGPVYGAQWRSWNTFEHWKVPEGSTYAGASQGWKIGEPIDQIAQIVAKLRTNPWDRRIILSSWNVGEIHRMKLPPCHFAAQFNVTPPTDGGVEVRNPSGETLGHVTAQRNRLNCLMNIRSWDTFLGGPFNIAQYALLTMMLAQICDLELGELVICSGDTHLYLNHLEQAKTQIARESRPAPRMILDPSVREIDDFKFEHFRLEGYDPHEHIKGEVSV